MVGGERRSEFRETEWKWESSESDGDVRTIPVKIRREILVVECVVMARRSEEIDEQSDASLAVGE